MVYMKKRAGDAASLRSAGETLGRDGLSRRVIHLVRMFKSEPTYKNAIILAGRMQAIAVACRSDDYWHEKAQSGYFTEMHELADLEQEILHAERHSIKASASADRPKAVNLDPSDDKREG